MPQSFEQLEVELLHGQKLQGTLTAAEVYHFLKAQNALAQYACVRACGGVARRPRLTRERAPCRRRTAHRFPLFHTVYRITFEGLPPTELLKQI